MYELGSLSRQSIENTLATLARVSAESVMPLVVTHAVTVLKNPVLMTVTSRDYEIMLTPEGKLYDQSVLER